MRVILRRGNDQVVTLEGLRLMTGTYLNAAVVKATLRDHKEQPLPAFTNVPMRYVPDSQGNYEWPVEGLTMMLPKGVSYSLEIAADQAGTNYRVVHPVSIIDGDVG
jgi:hypothetical protein